MVAMRERTAELGGSLLAGPQATGGRVRAWLPIAGSNRHREGSPDGAKLVAGEPESAASSALQVTG
jgi:hypothetical protein